MKAPPHPGIGLRQEIEAIDPPMSIAETADALGVSRQQLYRVLSGDSAISSEMAYRLELAGLGKAEFWLRLQNHHDLARIRARASSIEVTPLVPRVA